MMPRRSFAELPKTLFYLLNLAASYPSSLASFSSSMIISFYLFQVVLPTFILEKRSLLEMFADCMAHPDQFIR